jgi:hypothetical protein
MHAAGAIAAPTRFHVGFYEELSGLTGTVVPYLVLQYQVLLLYSIVRCMLDEAEKLNRMDRGRISRRSIALHWPFYRNCGMWYL